MKPRPDRARGAPLYGAPGLIPQLVRGHVTIRERDTTNRPGRLAGALVVAGRAGSVESEQVLHLLGGAASVAGWDQHIPLSDMLV
jgi:hypothetical protein